MKSRPERLNQVVYYRLKQVDMDGKGSYSKSDHVKFPNF